MLSGTIMPPAMPWTARKAIRLPTDQAAPHSAEPMRKAESANIHRARAPKRSTRRPVVGMTIAMVSR